MFLFFIFAGALLVGGGLAAFVAWLDVRREELSSSRSTRRS